MAASYTLCYIKGVDFRDNQMISGGVGELNKSNRRHLPKSEIKLLVLSNTLNYKQYI